MRRAVIILFLCFYVSIVNSQETVFEKSNNTIKESLNDTWLLEGTNDETFKIKSYKPIYMMFTNYVSGVNTTPSSGSGMNYNEDSFDFIDSELKFQLSFKTRVVNKPFGLPLDLWAAYTQSSRWQIFNGEISRPFRETNYEPEFMAVFKTNYNFLGMKGSHVLVSFNHQSNGRSNPFSRSWNRIIFEVGLDSNNFSILIRPWIRLSEDAELDDNPEIVDFIGKGELILEHYFNNFSIYTAIRHNLRFNNKSAGGIEANLRWHIKKNLALQAQVFHGYGESLLDYNYKQTMLGLGFLLN
jgi:phospholipase A1